MSSWSRAAKTWEAVGQVQAVVTRKLGSAAEKDVGAQNTSVGCGGRQPPKVTLEDRQTDPRYQDTGRKSIRSQRFTGHCPAVGGPPTTTSDDHP